MHFDAAWTLQMNIESLGSSLNCQSLKLRQAAYSQGVAGAPGLADL